MQETQETRVWSLGGEDTLKEGMATHSSILAWRIPWTEEPGGLQCLWSQRVEHNWSDLACMHTRLTESSLHARLHFMHFTQLCDNWAVLNPDCPLFLLEAPREGKKKKKKCPDSTTRGDSDSHCPGANPISGSNMQPELKTNVLTQSWQ